MDNQTNPPIGRYILIALIFVAIFVGVAYLIFRFSNRDSGTDILPSPSPTITATNAPSSVSYNHVVLPAPTVPALDKSRILPSPRPIATTIPGTNGQSNTIVATDGKGNLLINNLTHEENFALLRDRLLGDRQVLLAQLQGQQQLDQTKLTLQDRQADRNKALESQKLALQLQRDQLTEASKNSQANRLIAAQLQQAQLENQLAIAKLQQPQQLSAQAQIALLTAKAKIQAFLTQQQSAAQLALQKNQASNQAKLISTQAKNQLALTQAQAEQQRLTQTAGVDQQIKYDKERLANDIARLSETQKVQLANQLYALALQQNNYQQAITMTQLQAEIAQAQRDQAHQYDQDNAILQADINQQLMQAYRSSYYPY